MSTFDAHGGSYVEEVEQALALWKGSQQLALRRKTELLLATLAAEGGPPPGAEPWLDVGCGIGLLHAGLVVAAGAVIGVDPSLTSLRAAAGEQPRAAYAAATGTALPFADASFGAVLAMCVLHHVPRSGQQALVGEMGRVLRPGGLSIVFEHNPYHPFTRWVVSRCAFDRGVELIAPRQVSSWLSGAGLQPRPSRYLLFAPIPGRLFGWLERRLGALPCGTQYCTVARKPGLVARSRQDSPGP